MSSSFGLNIEWLKQVIYEEVRALIIKWTQYHNIIIYESPYKTLRFFFRKTQNFQKTHKTPLKKPDIIKKNQVGWAFYKKKNCFFFQPCRARFPTKTPRT